ncbi:MAG: helix-hairpin-helix domain-containing protein [Anaerolineae bacterium]|jgi:predicted flap endonuclease-1-like 5' DNA nuclease
MRKVLAVLFGLVLAATGVFLVVWLLSWLWKREQKAVEQIEIDVKMPPLGDMPDAECGEALAERARVSTEAEETPPRGHVEGSPLAKADDLKRIQGIGPKIASVLQEAGIRTFSGLAETGVEHIHAILAERDPRLGRLADPGTWPEQATLAASGDWEALAALQGELKGGRRS